MQERLKVNMVLKILQTNVGRAYAAQDMAYATARQKGIDLLVVGEPNKKRVSSSDWIKDTRVSVAALFLTRDTDIVGHRVGDGHITLIFKDFVLICCYISPNIALTNYKAEVDAIMSHVSTKEGVVIGDFNAKSPQ